MKYFFILYYDWTKSYNNRSKNDWNEVIKKEARGINRADFGEIQGIYSLYLLTKKG
jgi:hypothetical protein